MNYLLHTIQTVLRAAKQQQQRTIGVVCWLLLLLVLIGAPWQAAAQTNPITLDVQAGYSGTFRVNDWFPIEVQIANDGPDVRGVLAWSLPGQPGEGVFKRTIDLPRGARKQLTFYAYSHTLARNGKLQLLDGANVLVEQDTRLVGADNGEFLVGVLSSDPVLLNSLNAFQASRGASVSVLHLSLETLPDQSSALRSLNALFLHDVDTGSLSQAQRQAIALWVQGGGKLITSGGPDSARLLAGVADLLPAEIGGSVAQADLAPLVDLTRPTANTAPSATTTRATPQSTAAPTTTAPIVIDSPGAAPLNTVTPRADAQTLPNGGTPLIIQRALGSGNVILTTFDLAQLRGWRGELPLWQNLLMIDSTTNLRGQPLRDDLLEDVLRIPSLGLLSGRLLLALLIVYVLAIGPLNYLVLRRLRRLEWAWLSIPVTVLVFTAGFYMVGRQLRGSTSRVYQIAVVQAVEGQTHAAATAFVGLFSPQRTSYDLGFQPDALVSETSSLTSRFNDVASVQATDADVQVPDLLVDVSSVRALTVEVPVDPQVRVESVLQKVSGGVGGQLQNAGTQPLQDAIIVQNGRYQQLGTLAPGASQTVTLQGGTNFPWGVNAARDGVFDRQAMLTALFNNSNSRQLIDDQGVYLLAWSSTPTVPVQLGGEESSQDGVTLYIVRLNAS